MKRLYSFFLVIMTIIFLLFVLVVHLESQFKTGTTEKLVIYNWGDYIDPILLKEFTKETGIQIDYQTFDSNEAMYTKIKQGGTVYDVAIPSEYMIAKMIDEKMLYKLDRSKINGLEHIDSQFLGLSFDRKNTYSIPYFWGTLGIVYNDKMVKNPPKEWADLFLPDFKDSIMLVDGAREGMGIGLQTLGYSLNSKNQTELEEAAHLLYSLTPNIKAIVSDEIKGYMIQEAAAVAVSFSGEAREMLNSNKHLHYIVPSKGSNLWFDNIVIPKTAKNIEGAYRFINFMLRPENAARNAKYIGYATPNKAAKALLPKDITSNRAFYPTEETIANLETYDNLGRDYLGIYNDLYLQFKMYRK